MQLATYKQRAREAEARVSELSASAQERVSSAHQQARTKASVILPPPPPAVLATLFTHPRGYLDILLRHAYCWDASHGAHDDR